MIIPLQTYTSKISKMYNFYYKVYGEKLQNNIEYLEIDDSKLCYPKIVHFRDAVSKKWNKHFSDVTIHILQDKNVKLSEDNIGQPIPLDTLVDSHPKYFGSPKNPLIVNFNTALVYF